MNPSPAVQGLWQHVNRPSHPMVVSLYEKYANELLSTKPDNFRNEFNKLKIELYKTPVPEDIHVYSYIVQIDRIMSVYSIPNRGHIYTTTGENVLDKLPSPKTIGHFINTNNCYWNNMYSYWTGINKMVEEFNDAYYGFNCYIKQIRDKMEKDRLQLKLAQEEWESKQVERDNEQAKAEELAKYTEEQKIINEAKARLAQELYEAKVKAKMDELRSSM